jgi:hypothetical protein
LGFPSFSRIDATHENLRQAFAVRNAPAEKQGGLAPAGNDAID